MQTLRIKTVCANVLSKLNKQQHKNETNRRWEENYWLCLHWVAPLSPPAATTQSSVLPGQQNAPPLPPSQSPDQPAAAAAVCWLRPSICIGGGWRSWFINVTNAANSTWFHNNFPCQTTTISYHKPAFCQTHTHTDKFFSHSCQFALCAVAQTLSCTPSPNDVSLNKMKTMLLLFVNISLMSLVIRSEI